MFALEVGERVGAEGLKTGVVEVEECLTEDAGWMEAERDFMPVEGVGVVFVSEEPSGVDVGTSTTVSLMEDSFGVSARDGGVGGRATVEPSTELVPSSMASASAGLPIDSSFSPEVRVYRSFKPWPRS